MIMLCTLPFQTICSSSYRLGNFQMETPVSKKIHEQTNERLTKLTYATTNLK